MASTSEAPFKSSDLPSHFSEQHRRAESHHRAESQGSPGHSPQRSPIRRALSDPTSILYKTLSKIPANLPPVSLMTSSRPSLILQAGYGYVNDRRSQRRWLRHAMGKRSCSFCACLMFLAVYSKRFSIGGVLQLASSTNLIVALTALLLQDTCASDNQSNGEVMLLTKCTCR